MAVKIPAIPEAIKLRRISECVRERKRLHHDEKASWLWEHEDWLKREHSRRMLHKQKELLMMDAPESMQGEVDATLAETRRVTPYTKDNEFLKALLIMDPLAPIDDPPPRPPIFNPVPAEKELIDLIRLAYDESIEASRAERDKARDGVTDQKKKK